MKAVRNQTQQVELYQEKLQALRKRLQGVTARLGSEVKDGGVAREAEDAINELQRQMGEFERGVSEHQKTLEMTCRLQHAMEEYQFWCEDASATMARVRKFASQCGSTEAVSVLYQQFEKFVWPTVPQQEERIGQISQLAVRLHGAEEGQRYTERTVSKHSEMVESIRELSDGLLELEAKLKKENLRQQQQEREKERKEEERRKSETEEKDEGRKGNRKWKKKEQTDDGSTQERTEMDELKETGHTPELTTEHDWKELPVKRQKAANKKPPFQKSRSQEVERAGSEDRQHSSSSFCSTHTVSLSRSPMLASRRIHAIHSQAQPVEPQATPPLPSFSDIQKELQRKETQERSQQDASAGGLSETELQQQEVMSEDYLSNDEYECVSPDDISLPPLAETPESIMVQSDAEEGVCFSSHGVHISQCGHQYRAPSEHRGNSCAGGAVGCSTPPCSLQSSSRFPSESSSLVQSVLTVPFSSPLTSTLCSIWATEETNKTSVSQRVEHSSGTKEEGRLPSGSNGVLNSTHSHKDSKVTEKRISSGTWPQMKKHNPPLNEPQMTVGTQDKVTQNAESTGETLTQSNPSPQTAELNHSPASPNSSSDPPQPTDSDLNLQKDETPPQDSRFTKSCTTFPQSRTSISQDKTVLQSCPGSGTKAFFQTENPVSRPQKGGQNSPGISSVSQRIIYQSTSNSISNSAQAFSSLSSVRERPERKTEPVSSRASYKESNPPVEMKSRETRIQTSVPLSRNSSLQQSHPDPTSGNDQGVLSSQSSQEASSVSRPQSFSQTTTTTVIQQTVHTKTVSPESSCDTLQANNDLRSKQESPLSHGNRGLPEVHSTVFQGPICLSNFSTSSSAIIRSNSFSSQQSHQTVHTSHGSTCTQQCVHDTGMTPSSSAEPTPPPQPEAQSQALAQQANPHVTPLSSSPHLLTPDQDPNICQPTAIREEIKLQGPSCPLLIHATTAVSSGYF